MQLITISKHLHSDGKSQNEVNRDLFFKNTYTFTMPPKYISLTRADI